MKKYMDVLLFNYKVKEHSENERIFIYFFIFNLLIVLFFYISNYLYIFKFLSIYVYLLLIFYFFLNLFKNTVMNDYIKFITFSLYLISSLSIVIYFIKSKVLL